MHDKLIRVRLAKFLACHNFICTNAQVFKSSSDYAFIAKFIYQFVAIAELNSLRGGMVEIFLGNLFFSYELGWIDRASTIILKVVLGPRAHHGPGGHQWQKVAKKQKSKRNEIELSSFQQSIRLDELIIVVGSNVQIGCKMTKLWPSQDWPKVAARLILCHFLAISAIFLKI